ncbi:MAG TPA: hypothetical protein VMR19_04860 [Candidatus Saccharimonadales bacterium]|jgi:hypothetical protein|nr:hypothetical protein [Candidatus Saccharimonadales bacterium]
MKHEKLTPEPESTGTNHVFYIERDYYSTPQVLVIIAPDLAEAEKMFSEMLTQENDRRHCYGKLLELDLSKSGLIKLEPPGDRHFDH